MKLNGIYISVPLKVVGVSVTNEQVMWQALNNSRGQITQYEVRFYVNSESEATGIFVSTNAYQPNITTDLPSSGQPVSVLVSRVIPVYVKQATVIFSLMFRFVVILKLVLVHGVHLLYTLIVRLYMYLIAVLYPSSHSQSEGMLATTTLSGTSSVIAPALPSSSLISSNTVTGASK